jgi:hypothetical protein
MTAVQELAEAANEFRKMQAYWDEAPNAIELTAELAKRLELQMSTSPDTTWAAAEFAKYGTEYLLNAKVYGMTITSITAEKVRAYKK